MKKAYITTSISIFFILIFSCSASLANYLVIKTIDIPTNGTSIFVSGSYAYIGGTGRNDLMVIDISNIQDPKIKKTVNIPEIEPYYEETSATDLFVSGSYVYVTDESTGLNIFDINNPLNPIHKSSFKTHSWPWEVYVSYPYAYVAIHYDTAQGIEIINIEDSNNPYRITTDDHFGIFWTRYLKIQNSYAYTLQNTDECYEGVFDPYTCYLG